MCKCCGSELESIQLSAEEYEKLKDSVMVNVIQGKDVFNKTTPEVHKHTQTRLIQGYLFNQYKGLNIPI